MDTLLDIVIRLVAVLLFITVTVLVLTYLERKVLARIQQRVGPMRTGPWGLLQPIADALKLLVKEDLLPGRVDRVMFWIAPLVVFVPAFVIWVTIPFTQELVVRNMDLGIFFIVAVSALSTTGIVLAGISSYNKYALLGAARAAAQLITYELPVVFAILAVVMIAESLDLRAVVQKQAALPYIVVQPVGFLLFLLAGLAELGRTPFDIPSAESELMGGSTVEYSGMHWAMFYLAEYANTFALAALASLLYLGGWEGPVLPALLGPVGNLLWFLIKCYVVVILIFWVRSAFPRLRIDQLMGMGWKLLLSVSFANMVLTAFYRFYRWPDGVMLALSLVMVAGAVYSLAQRRRAAPIQSRIRLVPKEEFIQ
ncbi:MAG: NADH-quinone oxidoreductase subunit NuoH [Chloroflexi bacterium]|nr:NADH-quinone oxidoreductase subunit NuoH [Chloroflexota bacterium]